MVRGRRWRGAVATRPLGEQLSYGRHPEQRGRARDESKGVPIYRSARVAAAHAARARLPSTASLRQRNVPNVWRLRRRRAPPRRRVRPSADARPPAGWRPYDGAVAVAAGRRRCRGARHTATTGQIVDDNSFTESIRWFCDRRPEGCRGAKLQKDGWSSRLESQGGATFSVSPWDWPRSVAVTSPTNSTPGKRGLPAGAGGRHRHAALSGQRELCGSPRGERRPGTDAGVHLHVQAQRGAGRVRGARGRAAKAGNNGSLAVEDLRAAGRRALRSLCAVRFCTQALPEPATVAGVLLEPWDDTEEWARAHFKPEEQQRAREFACRGQMLVRRATDARGAAPVAIAAPDEDDALIERPARARAPPPPRVYFLHLHKCGGTSICQQPAIVQREQPQVARPQLQFVRRRPRTLGQAGERGYANLEWEEDCEGARIVRRSRKPAVPGGGALARCSLRLLAGLSRALLLRDVSAGAARAVPVAPRVRARVGGGRRRLGGTVASAARRSYQKRHGCRRQFLCSIIARPRLLLRYGSGQRHPRRSTPRVEIKILRRVRAESSRRPPRHRRNACSMAWRCRFLAARPSQGGRVIAEK